MSLAEAVGAASAGSWTGIMERVGIPAAFLLLVLLMVSVCVVWIARNVVRPVVGAHTTFVKDVGSTQKKLADNETRQTDILQEIRNTQDQQGQKIDNLDKDVRQVKGMVGKILKSSSSEDIAE